MSDQYWLWYPGDFELYHALQQNFSRIERGFGWPAFWKSEGFRSRIVIWREYELDAPTEFRVHANGIGFVRLNGEKHLFDRWISCGPGKATVVIHVGRIDALPSVYIEGDVIRSDRGWLAEDYDHPPVPVGFCKYFTHPEQDPAVWDYSEKVYDPIRTERCNGGVLYEFETELTAVLQADCTKDRLENMTVYYGESREEALDTEHCYYSWKPDPVTGKCPRSAVRFAFIPGDEIGLKAIHQNWKDLCRKIDKYYWDNALGAYLDSFTSGKRHVSRQTNLFALLFEVADEEKQGKIYQNVIANPAVAPITTPYFNFFALDALGRLGHYKQVMDSIRSYWGGMIERGAVTFWEEFDPMVTGREQYDMYGDRFGKSLCHAWSASPIYLIARYFIGLELNGPEGTDFVLTPHLECFDELDCTLPVGAKGDSVRIRWDGSELQVETSCQDGILQLGGKQILLNPETVCKTRLFI